METRSLVLRMRQAYVKTFANKSLRAHSCPSQNQDLERGGPKTSASKNKILREVVQRPPRKKSRS
ncbi:hypothetical protein CR513_25181, partial [Mucuna pruriens]